MRIEGKTFITTGGASGLGRAAAEAILGAGGNVLLLDVNDDVGRATAQTLGDRACFVKADVTSEAEVQAAVDEAVTHFGGLHGVVNAAGIASGGQGARQERPASARPVREDDPHQPHRHVQRHPAGGGRNRQEHRPRRAASAG